MIEINMDGLKAVFKEAKEFEVKYVAVLIRMEGFPKDETIINSVENVDTKLAYYEKTYDENLNHKFAKGIEIIDFTNGDSFAEIQADLIG